MGDHMVAAAIEQCTRRVVGARGVLQSLMKAWLVPAGMKNHLQMSTEKVTK